MDVGDVLVSTRPHLRLEALVSAGVSASHAARMMTEDAPRFDRGEVSESDFVERLLDGQAEDLTASRVKAAWGSLVGSVNSRLVRELLGADDSLIVSNTNPIDWRIVRVKLLRHNYAVPALLSFEINRSKPEHQFYEAAHALAGFGRPSELLLIDDQESNLNGAAAFGFSTHQHVGDESTIAAITQHRRRCEVQ